MIRFKVNPRWDEEQVAIRVAHIVSGEGGPGDLTPPFPRDGKWQLDRGNDYFLQRRSDQEYELRSRYEVQSRPLEGLVGFLENLFS